MSLLNFFRRNKQTVSKILTTDATPHVESNINSVDKELFVDNEAPLHFETTKEEVTPLSKFLDQNFELQGFNDGYLFPDAELMESRLTLIKAEFRKVIEICFDAKRTEVGLLNLHKVKSSGISARLEGQLEEKIKMENAILHELETQKNLSIEDQGLVSSAVHAYRVGFLKGLDKYHQEKFFASSTGLFNK